MFIRIFHSSSMVADSIIGPYETMEQIAEDFETNGWTENGEGRWKKENPEGWDMYARILKPDQPRLTY